MRTPLGLPALLAILGLAAATPCQAPLAMPFTANSGTAPTRGVVYFDLTVLAASGVTITALDLHTSAPPGTSGLVTIYTTPGTYLGNTGDPSVWTPGATAPVTSAGPGLPSRACIGAGLHLPADTYGVAVSVSGFDQRHTIGASCSSTTIPGSCANSVFANADLVFAGGAASSVPFSSTIAQPRIWNGAIHYRLGNTTGACAAKTVFGRSCKPSYASCYQFFDDAGAAHTGLHGNSIRFSPVAGGYRAEWGFDVYVPPTTAAGFLFPVPMNDHEALVTPSRPLPTPQGPQAQLRVHSNGVLSWGPVQQTFPGTLSWQPAAAAFLGGMNPGIYSWHDFNEAEVNSGRIRIEEVAVGGRAVLMVTWDGVESFAQPETQNRGTMQFQLDLTTGDVTIVWHDVDANSSSNLGSAFLVGYSPGGPSSDPGSIDLRTELPLVTAAFDYGVELDGTVPGLGTTWVLTSTRIEAGAPLAFQTFGSTVVDPAVDLAPLGAPGCRRYHTVDFGAFAFTVAGGAGTFAVAVPNTGALAGVQLVSQTLARSGANPAGIATSNAITGVLGL